MSSIRSKYRVFKYGINLLLISALVTILAQNVEKVDVAVLFWEVHIPLVFLLIGTALLGAMITFIFVIRIGSE